MSRSTCRCAGCGRTITLSPSVEENLGLCTFCRRRDVIPDGRTEFRPRRKVIWQSCLDGLWYSGTSYPKGYATPAALLPTITRTAIAPEAWA